MTNIEVQPGSSQEISIPIHIDADPTPAHGIKIPENIPEDPYENVHSLDAHRDAKKEARRITKGRVEYVAGEGNSPEGLVRIVYDDEITLSGLGKRLKSFFTASDMVGGKMHTGSGPDGRGPTFAQVKHTNQLKKNPLYSPHNPMPGLVRNTKEVKNLQNKWDT